MHYRKAISLSPTIAESYNGLGSALIAAGASAEAMQPLKRALELEPNHLFARINLGLALIVCGVLALVISIWQYRWGLRYLWGEPFTPIAGVTTEVCVQTTLREANDRGSCCLLVEDATESYFAEFKLATLAMIRAQGAIVGWTARVDELVDALEATETTPALPVTAGR